MEPWIHIAGLQIPSFILVQSLNACVLLWLSTRRAKAYEVEPRATLDLALLTLIAGLIGARVFHILWEAPDFYQQYPMQVFNLLGGGYVYYGGVILSLAVAALYVHVRGEDFAKWLDLFAPIVALGTAIGRIGCLLAGCCYGKACDLPWAIKMADEHGQVLLRHPSPLYEVIWSLGIFFVLLLIDRVPRKDRLENLQAEGSLFYIWMILYGFGRFFIEFTRDDDRGIFVGGFSVSQILSVVLVTAGAALMSQKKSGT